MRDDPTSPPAASRVVVLACAIVSVALAVTLVLASLGKQLSVDDHFRVYHVLAFLERPRFAPSAVWMPGYSWVVGAALTLTRETWWTPRFLDVGLSFVTVLVSARSLRGREARALAAALVASSPVFVLVAPTALSEAIFVLACASAARSLGRFRTRGRARDAIFAVAAASFASAVRYEAWLLLPVVALFVVTRRSESVRLGVRVALAASLAGFPLAWLDHVATREGHAFAFLDAVKTDMYGTGDLGASARGPGVVAMAVAALSLAFVLASVRLDRRPSMRVHQAFALTLFGATALAIAGGSVPSQLPIRILLPGTILAAVPVAGLVAGRVREATLVLIASAGIATGAWLFVSAPDVAPDGARAIGMRLHAELDRDPSAHVLTYGRFPDIVAVDVASSAIGRVHIEGTRRRCPIRLLTCDSPCATRPEFADAVRFAVLESPRSRTLAERAGFVRIAEAGRYRLYRRPSDLPPLCALSGAP